jgi:dephospho-CoA kinase
MYGENIEMLNRMIVAKAISIDYNLMDSQGSTLIVVGVRSFSLLVELQRVFPAAIAIFIDASRSVRYKRHVATGRLSIASSFRAFIANDLEQRKWGIEDVKSAASYIVQTPKTE